MTAFLHTAPLASRHYDGPPEDRWYSPREHARRLGMTEADLVEMDEGFASARLRPDWSSLLAALWSLGPTVARTCCEHAVLETAGIYPRLQGTTATAVFAGSRSELQLQLQLTCCSHVWAVKHGGQSSLQIFGQKGAAIHKVNLTNASNRAGWTQLLEAHAAPDLPVQTVPASAGPACSLTDERSSVVRIQARHRVEPPGAWQAAPGALRTILQAAAETRLPMKVTVRNAGSTHSCKGSAATLHMSSGWLEVSDLNFGLRVREAAIAEAWIVASQTEYGVAHTLEVFDRAGMMIIALSGCNDAPGPEERLWQAVLGALPLPAGRQPVPQLAPV